MRRPALQRQSTRRNGIAGALRTVLAPVMSVVGLTLLPAQPAAAQEQEQERTGVLTLAEALERADAGAYANRMSAGEAAAQAGEGLGALRGILPSVRLESISSRVILRSRLRS